jgi:hypothetical protein
MYYVTSISLSSTNRPWFITVKEVQTEEGVENIVTTEVNVDNFRKDKKCVTRKFIILTFPLY